MDLDPLRVLVVAQQRLQMLPATQGPDFSKRGGGDSLEGVGLAVTPDGTFDVGGLDFTPMVDDGAGGVDEGLKRARVNTGGFDSVTAMVVYLVYLCDIQTSPCPLAVCEHHKYPCFLHRSSDLVHFWRFLDERVRHVLVDQLGILEDRFGPDAPVKPLIKRQHHGLGSRYTQLLTRGNQE